MRARLGVYDKRGANFRGHLPFVTDTLKFSTNVDGDGDISYEALMSDVDALQAWDCTVNVELETTPGTWVKGPAYGMRHEYTHRGGSRRFAFTGRELLRCWAEEAILLPEQVVGHVYRTAGESRYLGWMSSVYDPARELWNLSTNTSRSRLPYKWPAGSKAKWVTARNFTAETEAKFYRGWITVPGTGRRRVRVYVSADEDTKVYIAGELVLDETFDEGPKIVGRFDLSGSWNYMNRSGAPQTGEVQFDGTLSPVVGKSLTMQIHRNNTSGGVENVDGIPVGAEVTISDGGNDVIGTVTSSSYDKSGNYASVGVKFTAVEQIPTNGQTVTVKVARDAPAWKKPFSRRTISMFPGRYAVGVYNESDPDKGGDGIDPVLVGVALLDAQGDIERWLLSSSETTLWAARRDDAPPNNIPPGPSPGAIIGGLAHEALERNCSGWPSLTPGFGVDVDSYAAAWGNFTEREIPIGDTYWDILQALAETDEADTWIDFATMRLHAAPKRGLPLTFDLTATQLHEATTKGTPGAGTWGLARSHRGWVQRQRAGSVRREYRLTVGEAVSQVMTERVIDASLRDGWRWDATGKMNPPQPGWIPFVDFNIGDYGRLRYRAIDHAVCVQGIAAEAGEGGLLFDLTMTEYPPDGSVAYLDGAAANPVAVGPATLGEH